MGVFVVDAGVMAGARFGVSPLAETVGALSILRAPGPQPWHAGWRRRHLPALRRRLADDPVAAALVHHAFARHWTADFLTVPPERPGMTLDDELAAMESLPDRVVRRDLERASGALAPELTASALGPAAAELLRWVWTETVLPTWPRRRRVLEADVVSRVARLSRDGWSGVLDDLRPGMRWLGATDDGAAQLQVNPQPNPPRDIRGADLVLTAAHCAHGWVTWRLDPPARYGIVYPVTGIFHRSGRVAPEALGRLIGPTRARVLMAAREPVSTTGIVARTGLPLGSVGDHLKVLADSGLLHRRRSGREVLSWWSTAAHELVAASAR
jgi:DNA-binding transcriptional ArsR family regulator